MLRVEGLSKVYRPLPWERSSAVWALDDVSLELGEGQIMALTGSNGSGKTTFLKIIVGLVSLDEGLVTKPERLGWSSGEERSLYWRLTALHNVELFAAFAGMKPSAAKARSKQFLAEVGLSAQAKTPVRLLSSGQRQRLLVARCLVSEPVLVLLDEPTNSLDAESRDLVWELLRQKAEAGAVIILTTHREDDTEKADVVATLAGGELTVSKHLPGSVRRAPEVESGFPTDGVAGPVADTSRSGTLLWPLLALLKRDVFTMLSYPLAFVLQVAMGVVEVVLLFFLAQVVGTSTYLAPFGGKYFGFAVLG
ncbi:MAG: hypothetical protein DLM70_01020, partial [Chloroflexi bacterium]